MNLSSSFYRLILGYYSPSTHHPDKQYSSYLSALLEIIISVSGEKPLPVRGLLLQHHNHATKVASLLLFLFFLRQLNSMYFFSYNARAGGILQILQSDDLTESVYIQK